MAGVNKVILVGNLGKDPESQSFANGGSVVKFSLATSETWRDKQTNERKEKTEWHNVVIYNEPLGKIATQFLKKGSTVYLEGAIQSRKFQDSSGNERTTTEVVLQRFRGELTLLGGRDGGGARDGGGGGGPDAAYDRNREGGGGSGGASKKAFGGNGNGAPHAFDDLDDDVPF